MTLFSSVNIPKYWTILGCCNELKVFLGNAHGTKNYNKMVASDINSFNWSVDFNFFKATLLEFSQTPL